MTSVAVLIRFWLIIWVALFITACIQVEAPSNTASSKLNTDICQNLAQLSWQEHNLYEVTYQCLPEGWQAFFAQAQVKVQLQAISDDLAQQVASGWEISPSIGATFKALYMVKPNEAKAVILGQDPAPQPGLATGLSFSLPKGTPTAEVASVQRVFLEASNQGFCMDFNDGDASKWAKNKVLLLNMALTIPCPKGGFCKIAEHIPLWEGFTDMLMGYIGTLKQPMAFIFWGSKAKKYKGKVNNPLHRVFEGGHPSPQAPSSHFFCKNYFTCANKWLATHNVAPINWNLTSQCVSKPCCIWGWDSEIHTSFCEQQCTEQDCVM